MGAFGSKGTPGSIATEIATMETTYKVSAEKFNTDKKNLTQKIDPILDKIQKIVEDPAKPSDPNLSKETLKNRTIKLDTLLKMQAPMEPMVQNQGPKPNNRANTGGGTRRNKLRKKSLKTYQ